MIKIHKSKNRQYYFTVSARNGQVLVTSETYTRKRNIVKSVAALKKALVAVKILDETNK